MRITLITGVFPPEPVVTAQTSAQIAEELVRRGHSVHVLAPQPNRPKGKLFNKYKRKLFFTSMTSHGYALTHCFGTFSANSTMISRLAENLSFGITSGLRLLCCQRPDVVYSNSWPIFATGIVAGVARLRGVPLVISVQDVYPESLGSQNRIGKQNWLYWLLRACDRLISRSAEQLIVISPRFQQIYETDRCVLTENIHVVQNWGSDSMYSWDTTAAMALRQELGIPKNAFVTVYAGNIGFASNAEMLVDVFAKLNERSQIYLVIAGDGSRLGACQAQVKINHLGRVLIHSPWKTEETGPVLQMADVLLLPTKGRQSLNSIPSKLIAYFLSGRPVIGAVLPESDTGIAILESGAGWVVDPDSVDLIAEAIVAASELSTERLSQMGSAGRKYALQNHMRESNLARVIHIVEQAARPRSREGRESRGSDFVPVSKQNGYGIDVDLRIVRANHSHLDSIVRIHLAAFEGFFLESLGKRFLRELYRGFLVEPSGVCLVAIDRENVVGFVAGTTQPEGFFRILLRSRWLEFLCAGAASLTMHPLRVGKKFLSALSYQGKRPVDVPNAALLSSIGVAPSRKGSGIGKILISAFCEKAYASGAYTVYLTTDRDKNDAVNQFYLSNGFKLHSSFLKERKRWMNLYIYSLYDAQPSNHGFK